MSRGDAGDDRLSLREPLPSEFERRTIVIATGARIACLDVDWRDAIVIVERGDAVLEARSGLRYRFREGDVLYMKDLDLRALHNPGPEPIRLVAVTRRRAGPDEEPAKRARDSIDRQTPSSP